jgi:two-component system sensor histidine kinase/response regulator
LLEATVRTLGGKQTEATDEVRRQPVDIDIDISHIYGSRILLVEDNELNQQVAVGILAEGGFAIDIAQNGKIAVEKATAAQYDIVLMDMQMPVMDGLEATRRIRANPALKDLPIIAMTANAMQADRELCVDAGMNDHIAKPFDPNQLFATLVKWMKPNTEQATVKQKKLDGKANQTRESHVPHLKEVDTALGLRRLMGKDELYLNVLRKYSENQKDATEQIRTALDKNERETAKRLAHTLKGLSGSIGAEKLQDKAATLEKRIQDGAERNELEGLLHEAEQLLFPIISELERKLPDCAHKDTEKKPAATTPVKKLLIALEELEPCLRASKPKKCVEVLAEYRNLVWPDDLCEDAAQLDNLTCHYKFKDALELLHSLQTRLKG